MSFSSLGRTVATSQLIESFSDVDVETFKKRLIDQFDCENEKAFLQKILIYSQHHLSLQTINNIHSAAIDISIKSKYPQQKLGYVGLSLLPRNVIQCVGCYLTILECIKLGYCNRNFYIETQRRSFVLKRRSKNDTTLAIGRKILISLQHLPRMTGFAFQYPFNINFGMIRTKTNHFKFLNNITQKEKDMFKNTLTKHHQHLSNILNNVKCIHINNYWSDLIPIDQLFGQHCNYSNGNKNTYCNRKNELDIVFSTIYSLGCGLETFLNNFNHYCTNSAITHSVSTSAAKVTPMRMINNLIIRNATIGIPFVSLQSSRQREQSEVDFEAKKKQTRDRLQLFFGTLKGCYKNLSIYRGEIEIDNFQLLSSIFHCNLAGITLGYPNVNCQRNREFTHGSIRLTNKFVKEIQKYCEQLQQPKEIRKIGNQSGNNTDETTALVSDSINTNTNHSIQVPKNFKRFGVCLYHSYQHWIDRKYIITFWKSMNQLSMFTYLETLSLQFSDIDTITKCLCFNNGWLTTTLKSQNHRKHSIPNLNKICIAIKNDFFETADVSIMHGGKTIICKGDPGLSLATLNHNHGYPDYDYRERANLDACAKDEQHAGKRFYMTHLVLEYLSIMSKNGIFGKCKKDGNINNNINTNNNHQTVTVEINWIFECGKDRYVSKATGRATNGRKCFLDCANYKTDQVAQAYVCQGCGYNAYTYNHWHSNSNAHRQALRWGPSGGERGHGCARWIPINPKTFTSSTRTPENINDKIGQDHNHDQDKMVINGHKEGTIYTKCETTSIQDNYHRICDWIVHVLASQVQRKQKQTENFRVEFKFDV